MLKNQIIFNLQILLILWQILKKKVNQKYNYLNKDKVQINQFLKKKNLKKNYKHFKMLINKIIHKV